MSEAEWDAWDEQIREDLRLGRLDKLLQQVDNDHAQGLALSFCEGKKKFYQANSVNKNQADEQS